MQQKGFVSNTYPDAYDRLLSVQGLHRFHINLCDTLVMFSATMWGVARYYNIKPHHTLSPHHETGTNEPHIQLESKLYPLYLLVPTFRAFEVAMFGTYPEEIYLHFTAKDLEIKAPDMLPGLARVHERIVASNYIVFADPWIKWMKRESPDYAKWPSIMIFARHVRNALAHGNLLTLSDSSASSEWRGVVLSPKESGTNLLNNFLSFADLLALMSDIDRELEKLGAPRQVP